MILVVGGANLDSTLRTHAPAVLRTSNPAVQTQSAGGVGRNIAENLARLGRDVTLVAAIGADGAGRELVRLTRAAGVVVDQLIPSAHSTGSYIAILDDDGELVIGVSDMAATDSLTVADFDRMPGGPGTLDALVAAAQVLVLDGNLPAPVNAHLLDVAAAHRTPVVLDPVSVAKAAPIGGILSPARPVFVLTPNVEELAALLGRPVANDEDALAAAAEDLHRVGVANVWIRRGPRGSAVSTLSTAKDERASLTTLLAPEVVVIDVTGAGDSMTAGFVHAWLDSDDVVSAARYGQALASLTVESAHTVRPDLTPELVAARLDRSTNPSTTDAGER